VNGLDFTKIDPLAALGPDNAGPEADMSCNILYPQGELDERCRRNQNEVGLLGVRRAVWL
jgi:hypothetical protein